MLNEYLGTDNSFTLNDGRFADEYVVNSSTDGEVAVAIASQDFTAQVDVVQVNNDGYHYRSGPGPNDGACYYAAVTFQAQNGATYEIVVTPTTLDGSGNYTVNLTDGLGGIQQGTPTSPTPTPTPTTTPTTSTYSTVVDETLGNGNSFILSDNRFADEYVVNASADADVAIAIASDVFNPQVQVVQLYSDGSTTVVGQDANPTATYYGAVAFHAQAGATYEVVVLPNTVGDSGAYTVNLTDGLTGLQQVTPSNYA